MLLDIIRKDRLQILPDSYTLEYDLQHRIARFVRMFQDKDLCIYDYCKFYLVDNLHSWCIRVDNRCKDLLDIQRDMCKCHCLSTRRWVRMETDCRALVLVILVVLQMLIRDVIKVSIKFYKYYLFSVSIV